MGQRHQIYAHVTLESKARDGKITHRTIKAGIYHQWLYGHTAVKQAKRFIQFFNKKNYLAYDLGSEEALHELLRGIYSLIPEESYYHPVCILDKGIKDPRLVGNNDGVTIFRVYQKAEQNVPDVSYAMMSLGSTEGQLSLPGCIPVTARQYLRSYYPALAYSYQGEVNEDAKAEFAKTLEDLEAAEASHLTWKDLAKMFPAMEVDLVKAEDADKQRPPMLTGDDLLVCARKALQSRSTFAGYPVNDALESLVEFAAPLEEALGAAEQVWIEVNRPVWEANAKKEDTTAGAAA